MEKRRPPTGDGYERERGKPRPPGTDPNTPLQLPEDDSLMRQPQYFKNTDYEKAVKQIAQYFDEVSKASTKNGTIDKKDLKAVLTDPKFQGDEYKELREACKFLMDNKDAFQKFKGAGDLGFMDSISKKDVDAEMKRFKRMSFEALVPKNKTGKIDNTIQIVEANKQYINEVAEKSGVPAEIIGAIIFHEQLTQSAPDWFPGTKSFGLGAIQVEAAKAAWESGLNGDIKPEDLPKTDDEWREKLKNDPQFNILTLAAVVRQKAYEQDQAMANPDELDSKDIGAPIGINKDNITQLAKDGKIDWFHISKPNPEMAEWNNKHPKNPKYPADRGPVERYNGSGNEARDYTRYIIAYQKEISKILNS